MPGSAQSTASDVPFLSMQRRQQCGACSIPARRPGMTRMTAITDILFAQTGQQNTSMS